MKNRIVILGAGESGVGAAILAKAKNFEVFVSDFGEIKAQYKQELIERGIEWEEHTHTAEKIINAGTIIKSPGIPEKAPIVAKCLELGIPVISEIEFASRYTSAFTICITGSNGKTTTTMLSYEILKRGGVNVGLAGNIGQSFARQVAECNFTHYVLELSSFQLDGMFEFRANVAVLMNITPDHLDRYDYKMQNYVDSKFRIIQNQTAADYFIYFAEDEIIAAEIKKLKIESKLMPFTFGKLDSDGACIEKEILKIVLHEKTFEMSIFDLSLQGKHNSCNSMAAAIAGTVTNIRKEHIRECLSDFSGVEHRLEKYLTVNGVDYINDSKATNINSVWYALESMQKPVVWIVGGVDKGNDYNELTELVKAKVKAIVCLGKDNSRIIEAFTDIVPTIIETDSMERAIKSSYFLATMGDVVLLSPACASFDLFENYEDRGRQFKAEVKKL